MRKLLPLLCVIIWSLIPNNDAKANRIMASDLSWQCVGQDSFLIKLVVYRDCNGDPLTNSVLNINCAGSGDLLTTVYIIPGIPVDITPIASGMCSRCSNPGCSFPYGIHRYIIQVIKHINNAGSCCDLRLSWELCCRNLSITNGSAGQNFYTEALLNRCQNPCDNSPTCTNSPISIICAGQPFTFEQGVQDIDVDGKGDLYDSLVFELAEPLQGKASAVNFSDQFAYNKPLTFYGFPDKDMEYPGGFYVSPESGLIQFKPVKPENAVFSVKINEYRNGIKIAEQRREMQIMVIQCANNHQPIIKTPGNVLSKSVCSDDPVTFNFTTNDSDLYDTLTISWNESIKDAKWSTTNGISSHPIATFTWTPTDKDTGLLPHTFTVTVKDRAYPIRGTFTQNYQIIVKSHAKGSLRITDSCNGLFYFTAIPIYGYGPSYMWLGQSFTFIPNIGKVVHHKFQYGIFPFTMTMTAGGCCFTLFDTLKYFPITISLPKDTSVCQKAQLKLRAHLEPIPYNYFVQWGSGGEIFQNDTLAEKRIEILQDTTIFVNVFTSVGCLVATDTIHIKMLGCVSVQDESRIKSIKIVPNPSSGDFSIKLENSDFQITKAGIFDSYGKQVREIVQINSDQMEVRCKELEKGLYFIRIVLNDGNIVNKKLILY